MFRPYILDIDSNDNDEAKFFYVGISTDSRGNATKHFSFSLFPETAEKPMKSQDCPSRQGGE